MKHICIPSNSQRLSGSHPMNCIYCDIPMTIIKALENEEMLMVQLGVLKVEIGMITELKPLNESLDLIRKMYSLWKELN